MPESPFDGKPSAIFQGLGAHFENLSSSFIYNLDVWKWFHTGFVETPLEAPRCDKIKIQNCSFNRKSSCPTSSTDSLHRSLCAARKWILGLFRSVLPAHATSTTNLAIVHFELFPFPRQRYHGFAMRCLKTVQVDGQNAKPRESVRDVADLL